MCIYLDLPSSSGIRSDLPFSTPCNPLHWDAVKYGFLSPSILVIYMYLVFTTLKRSWVRSGRVHDNQCNSRRFNAYMKCIGLCLALLHKLWPAKLGKQRTGNELKHESVPDLTQTREQSI